MLAPAKTVFVVFSTQARMPKSDLFVRVGNQKVFASSSVTYLGVVFHSDCKGRAHVEANIARARSATNLVKNIARESWASHPKTMVQVTLALVRSRLTYGLEAAYDVSKSHWDKMEATECRALKMALGLPRWTPRDLTYKEAGVLPLRDSVRLQCARYRLRSQTVPNSTTWEVSEDPSGLQPPEWMVGFRTYTQPLLDRAGVEDLAVLQGPGQPEPPWLRRRPTVETALADCSKQDPPLYVGMKAREEVDLLYRDHLQIFTDGSVGDGGVGAAFSIPALGIERQYSLPRVSIFVAELVAIQKALQYLRSQGPPGRPVVILSDSLAALTAIQRESGTRTDLVGDILDLAHYLLRERDLDLSLQWVPSHVGVRGNELADRAAKSAALGSEAVALDLPLSYSDARPRVTAAAWEVWRETLARTNQGGRPLVDTSPPVRSGRFTTGQLIALMQMVARLRCGVWRCQHPGVQCGCPAGAVVSPHHCLFECADTRHDMGPLHEEIRARGLPLAMSSLFDERGGLPNLLTRAAKLLYDCPAGAYI